MDLGREQKRFFDAFGYLVFPKYLSAVEIQAIETEFEAAMAPLRASTMGLANGVR